MADGILLKCKCLFIGSGAWITFWKRAVITGCDWVRLAVCSKRGTREADTAYLTALNSCLLHTNPSQLARICILQDTSISAITAFLKEAPRSLHKSHSLSLFPVLKVKVLVAQLCLTLCNSMDCSPLGSSVMGFSRQEYWSVLPCPSLWDLPDPGIEPGSPALQADSLLSEPPGKPFPPEEVC